MRGSLTVSLATLLVALLFNISFGATINVPADQPTIQAGIDAASSGDTVLLSTGIYTGDGNRLIAIWNKALVLTSQSGSSFTIIDPQDASIAFELVGADVEMNGLTIRNAPTALYVEDTDLRLDDLSISNCDEGVSVLNGSTSSDRIAQLQNSAIIECGIGILACNSSYDSVSVLNTSFIDNGTALFGCQGSPLIVDTCFFNDNTAVSWGTLTLQNSIIDGGINGVTNDGDESHEFIVRNTTFSDLTGTVFFSRIYGQIVGCTITNCTGTIASGGTVVDDSPSLHFRNCSFYSNSGNIGLRGFRPRLTIDSCYFENHTGSIVYEGNGGFGNPLLSVSHCEFRGGGGQPLVAVQSWGVPISVDHTVFSNIVGVIIDVDADSVALFNNTVVNCDSTFAQMIVYSGEWYSITKNIAANNGGPVLEISLDTLSPITIACNDFWNNVVNSVGMPNPVGSAENFAADPLFCSDSTFRLFDVSPCAPAQSSCGQLVGAKAVACTLYTGPVWYVSTSGHDTTGDGSLEYPFATIQKGLDAANTGDTVLVAPGTYSGEDNNHLTYGGKGVVLLSLAGRDSTVINLTPIEPYGEAGILFTNGEDSTAVLDGFTIEEGRWEYGAVYCQGSSPIIRNCIIQQSGQNTTFFMNAMKCISASPSLYNVSFRDNISGCGACKGEANSQGVGVGAALHVSTGSSVRLMGCEFLSNWSDDNGHGGAVSVSESQIVVDSCTFTSNEGAGIDLGSGGGALAAYLSAVEIYRSLFETNEAYNSGGALYLESCDSVRISSCRFVGNTCAAGTGGAVYGLNSILVVDSCEFNGNVLWEPAGGGAVSGQGVFRSCDFIQNEAGGPGDSPPGRGGAFAGSGEFYNCLFERNTAWDRPGWGDWPRGGGAVYGSGEFVNCTFVGNSADSGSAIYALDSGVTLTNCIIAFNRDSLGMVNAVEGPASASCTDVYGHPAGNWTGGLDGQGTGNNNMEVDPLFCDTTAGDFGVADISPCAAVQSPCGQLVGAKAVACTLYTGPVWHVSTSGSDSTGDGSWEYPFVTIQKGLDAADIGDTVLVAPGTYSGEGNHDLDFLGKGIVLLGSAGRDETTIDIDPADTIWYWSGFQFVNGEDSTAVLDGFTITNGDSYPGAIYIDNSSPTIRNCRISSSGSLSVGGRAAVECRNSTTKIEGCEFIGNAVGCSACKAETEMSSITAGAALSITAGSNMTIRDCTFSDNIADDDGPGGAVAIEGSSAAFIRCAFENSYNGYGGIGSEGGAIAGIQAKLVFDDCAFTGNRAAFGGGAIYLEDCDSTLIVDCIFDSNLVGWIGTYGGAIYCVNTPVIAHNTVFKNNHCSGSGGAVVIQEGQFNDCTFLRNATGLPESVHPGKGGAVRGSASFINCLFVDNLAEGFSYEHDASMGGAIFGSGTLQNCTLVGNEADSAAAIYSIDSGVTLTNCIVAFNVDTTGLAEIIKGPAQLDCSDVYGHPGGNWIGGIVDQDTIVGNLEADPLFCDTTAGDFGVADISPCAADNNDCAVNLGSEGITCSASTGPARYVANWGQDLPTSGSELDPYQTIAYAIQASLTGDSIILHPGTYEGAGNWDLSFGDKNLVLTALSDTVSQTVIVCGTDADPHHWGIWLTSAQDSSTVIDGITLTDTDNHTMSWEPGLRLQESSAIIRDCAFVNLGLAGAMKVNGGSPLIDSCNFSNCQAGNSALKDGQHSEVWNCGGGMYTDGGAIEITGGSTATLRNCQFINNIGDYQNGGAIAISGSTPLIEDCQFTGNASYYEAAGGHVSLCGGSDAVFKRCTFTNGQAGFSVGGAIACDASSPVFDSCVFTGNFAPDGGGALHCQNAASPSFSFCQFENNYSHFAGGAFLLEGSSGPSFLNCTIKGSWAGEDAVIDGQVLAALEASQATFNNCLIAFNGYTGGPFSFGDPESSPALYCSNVYNPNDGPWTGCTPDNPDSNGNFSIDPAFCNGLEIAYTSFCAPQHSPCEVLVGALSPNCAAPCCRGMTGNVDYDYCDVVNLTDLTKLVNYLFVIFEPPPCRAEANTSGDAACDITLSDLTLLVNYLFVTYDSLANCADFNEASCGQM